MRTNAFLLAFAFASAGAGCGPRPSMDVEGSSAPPSTSASSTEAACLTPATDCPCSTPGQRVSCGKVLQTAGDYVTCSEGTRTCSGGTWGDCIGEYVTQRSVSSARRHGIETLGLNASVQCTNNPCDPTCNTFVDDPSGLDAGVDSGLQITDAGISLFGNPISVATCSGIVVTPNTAPSKDLVITSMDPSPNTVQFAASLLPNNCYPIKPTFLWSIDRYDIAQIGSDGLLTMAVPIAGPVTVTAYAGTLSASVVSNITVDVVDTSAAPNGFSNAQFPTTTGRTENIDVLYPYPGTVFPLGLPPPLIQWDNNGTKASAVKVTLRFPATGTPIFSWAEIVPELQSDPTPSLTAQPRATIPATVWNDFQQTVVRNSGSTGGDAAFVIQRYVSGRLRTEVPTTIHFANGQLKGNIFYNSYGTNLVSNFGYTRGGQPFGAATLEVPVNGTSPTVVVGSNDPTLSGAGCRVCHNVAANGASILSNSYLEFGSSGSGDEATSFLYDPTLGSPAAIQASESRIGGFGSNLFTFAALAPDGSYLLNSAAPASSGSVSKLYAPDGSVISSNIPSGLQAATPAFSADAAHVAFNYYGGTATPLSSARGDGKSLYMMDFSPPNTFSNFRKLYTPSALYSVWPSFLPPGQNGVVFQNEITSNGRDWAGTRSQCDGTGSCNNVGATGELWWVNTTGTPVATRLANLNGGSYMPRNATNLHGTSSNNGTYYEEVYNYEPAVLPVTIGGYSWVAFTSRRMYGNVATINPYWSDPRYQDISVQPTTKKIWIAAIAPNPTPGTDPSYPAFYLPGQELLAGNARAYFSLAACEPPGPPSSANECTSNLDCCGGTASPPTAICQLDPPPLANPPVSHCVAAPGTSCVADGDACTTDAECCNFGSGARCGSGKCNAAPPLDLYSPSVFTTTYIGNCTTLGQSPVWRFFYWEASTPTGTSISFQAEASADGVTWGAPVSIGTAAPPPVTTSTWTSAATTVDEALQAAGQKSQVQLKILATLNPDGTGTITPTLTNWQLQYDCVDSQ